MSRRLAAGRRAPSRTSVTPVLLTSLALLLASCTGGGDDGDGGGDEQPDDVGGTLAAAWTELDPAAFAEATDDPAAARRAFTAMVDDLGLSDAEVVADGEPACSDDGCSQDLDVTVTVAGLGPWTYATTATSAPDADAVTWDPSLLHPQLTEGAVFTSTRRTPARAPILGVDGRPLTSLTEVFEIGVVAGKVRPATYDRLGRLLDVDTDALRERVEASEPDWFVDVITLRDTDYAPVRDDLLEVPGISIDDDRLQLAPTSGWGRAVLGTVAPATEDSLETAGPYAVATDQVGASGLQARFEPQLAGEPGGRVTIERANDNNQTVWRTKPVRGEPLETTLDRQVQDAAEQAVAGQEKTTAVVAVDAGSGAVRAAVNGPEVTSYDTALAGNYPPGSTLKVVTAAALLADGLGVDDPVECPATVTVDGAEFENYDGLALGPDPTFAEAVAASCNTAVIGEVDRLDDDTLADTAATMFGLGAPWDVSATTFEGSVPRSTSATDLAASMIGQGRVEMSPLGMALVAGAVASGQASTPTLVPSADEGGPTGDPVPGRVARGLREIMELTVDEGTATVLGDVPGRVGAKTGTAEYGTDVPPRTHAWMIAYAGDLAYACLVLDGESGSGDCGPVLREVLTAVG